MIMYPAYTWTDSHPHHAHPKASEMNPSHTNLSPLYQPWSYAGNYPHPVPHGCCNHTYYGGGPYGFQPHYAHYPPPPPPAAFYPHGFYSPFPGAYPAYPVPPQHYSVELPRYDYDKNNHAPHPCCGCHHQEDEKIKKESQAESQVESQVDNKKSDSLVPLLLKDRPDYPIMWVPRGYMSNADSKAKEMAKYSHNHVSIKHHEPSSKQGGDGEMAQDGHGGDNDRFPFQIFWLPSKNDEVREDTKENSLDQIANKGLSDEKTIKNECQGNEGECKTSSKHVVQKVIPVKQVGTNEEKKNLKSTEVAVNSDSVEKTNNGSRASPKTSKLPPVCLRIDPLPRKKKSSFSPSPSERERSSGSLKKDPKSSQQQAQVLKKSKEEQSVGNIKTVDHANKKVEQDNIADQGDIVPRGEGAASEKETVGEKKNLSEDEAALIIQSVYHGFEVRKSQPLKKLKQIYEVRKQVFELRYRIQDLESLGVDGKKEVIIGETIMSLLLKLDTIQGLHPFVREVRKSVAKELVGLQGKLDSLTPIKSETPTMCGPQQVMQPEDDVIQENSDQARAQLGLLENKATESQDDVIQENSDQAQAQLGLLENKATESQCDDNAEKVTNLEQQVEKRTADDSIQDKFKTDSDMVIGENHEVEAIEDIGEAQLGLLEDKCEQEPTERDEGLGLCDTHEMEATESQGNCNEPQLELPKEKLDEVPTESNEAMGLCETHEVEVTKSQEGCNAIGVQGLESDKEETATQCDEAMGLMKTHEMEAIESEEGCNTIGEPEVELDKKKSDEAASECDRTNEVGGTDTGCVDMELAHNSEELNKKQSEMPVESVVDKFSIQEDAVSVENVSMDSELPKKDAADELEELIRELRGRVKDLEKKLSKNKKVKVNRCSNRRRSRGCVDQKEYGY